MTSIKSEYLLLIIGALRKRSKAIKHKVITYTQELKLEHVDDDIFERLNIYLELHQFHSSISVSIWEDREFFMNVRQKMSNDRYFNCKLEGRIGGTEERLIVRALEETISNSHSNEGHELCKKIREIWVDIVKTGPRQTIN